MIVVIGEALVDLVAATDGTLVPALGGAPYNTARAVARLGGEVEFVGALSEDGFGQRLARQLIDDGVNVSRAPRTTRPTSLAVAEIGPEGGAEYRFYLQGTSVPELTAEILRPVARDAEIVFTGGLALVVEPAASAIAELVDDLHDSTIVVVDLNCRPAAIDDQLQNVRPGVVSRRVEVLPFAQDVAEIQVQDFQCFPSHDRFQDPLAVRSRDRGAPIEQEFLRFWRDAIAVGDVRRKVLFAQQSAD